MEKSGNWMSGYVGERFQLGYRCSMLGMDNSIVDCRAVVLQPRAFFLVRRGAVEDFKTLLLFCYGGGLSIDKPADDILQKALICNCNRLGTIGFSVCRR